MTYDSIRHISFSTSVVIHIVVLIIFLLVKVSQNYTSHDFVELSFGNSGYSGSGGGAGYNITSTVPEQKAEEQIQTTTIEKKEVELPETKNNFSDDVIAASDHRDKEPRQNTIEGQGNKGKGKSGFGFDIDWGGRGTRKIYSYILPAYPDGVNKEADIRLRFVILSDGTVGNVFPLTKGDTKLETAAINSLRQWRFEPLNPSQKEMEQTAVIVFPYRLQ